MAPEPEEDQRKASNTRSIKRLKFFRKAKGPEFICTRKNHVLSGGVAHSDHQNYGRNPSCLAFAIYLIFALLRRLIPKRSIRKH